MKQYNEAPMTVLYVFPKINLI